MVQHLELCPILAVACSAYAQRPHLLQVRIHQCTLPLQACSIRLQPGCLLDLCCCCCLHGHCLVLYTAHIQCSYSTCFAVCLQFFAPHASIGSVHMPAAVYLLDIHRPGPDVRNYMDLVAPVLSSRDVIKVRAVAVCMCACWWVWKVSIGRNRTGGAGMAYSDSP